MAQEPEIAGQSLRIRLLVARCELDRRELEAELRDLQDRWYHRVDQVRRATPWVLAAAPVVGLLFGRSLRGARLARATVLARLTWELRRWWPFVDGFLRGGRSAK